MASIDLKDALYSIPVYKDHQVYMTCFVKKYLKFVSISNGYGPAVRIFKKKNSKIRFSILREEDLRLRFT